MDDIIVRPDAEESPPPQKSKFVTVTAWVSIVYWGLSLVLSLLGIMIVDWILRPEFLGFDVYGDAISGPRRIFADMLRLLPVLLWVSIISALLLLGAAAGLLRRRNWARLMTVALLVFLIVYGIVSGAYSLVVVFRVARELGPGVLPGMLGGSVGGLFSTALFMGLYGFVAWKLTRPDIRAEFE